MNFQKQYHAGFIAEGALDLLANSEIDNIDWKGVFRYLSSFEVESNISFDVVIKNPLLSVFNNIICRGLPTKASTMVEDYLLSKYELTTKRIDSIGGITYRLRDLSEEQISLIKRSFIIIDPKLNRGNKLQFELNSWESLGSELEESFFYKILPDLTGDYIIQLIEPQRSIESIIKITGQKKRRLDSWLGNNVQDFYNQRADFTLEFPCSKVETKYPGMIIEVDGSQHEDPPQKKLDEQRDRVLNKINWFPTVRIKSSEINKIPKDKIDRINRFLDNPYINLIKQNYDNPINLNVNGKSILEYCLVPLAIGRIQKLLVELIQGNILKYNAEKWKIAFLERDISAAEIAVKDFIHWISTLNKISGNLLKLPEIEVINVPMSVNLQNNDIYEADVLIDISILQRPGFTSPEIDILKKLNNPPWFTIRSSFSVISNRKLLIDRPVIYRSFVETKGDSLIYNNELIQSYRIILHNIFRKYSFRPGQLEIINRALQRKDVIGLLPTGAGKSITYQLAAILQPGITIIVDPIKSLMKDQNDNLLKAAIDSTVFINSSIKSPEDRRAATMKVVRGEILFTFISPERFQIEEFRKYLQIIYRSKINFSYCVVDETHCVSEWGHDFRTAYLRLGENTRNLCLNRYEKFIPIIGLTGTASYDVLSDVQRELDIHEEEAIIKLESSDREELIYNVIEVTPSYSTEKIEHLTDKTKRNFIPDAKKSKLIELLTVLPFTFNSNTDDFYKLDGDSSNAGLVFAPHVSEDSGYGVKNILPYIKENIQILSDKADLYAGSANDGEDSDDVYNLEKIQEDYSNNKKNLLVTTKAFGMGVDKPNIRYTIHMNIPPSIESFYQEAGRAGRDRQQSYCNILYTRNAVNANNVKHDISSDKDINTSFLQNSFKGTEKELSILFELLNDIKYPTRPNTSIIEMKIFEKTGVFYRLNYWEVNGHKRFYVNKEDKTFGYINLNNVAIVTETDTLKAAATSDISRETIKQVFEVVKSEVPPEINLVEWLRGSFKPPDTPGILKILEKINPGDSYVTNISFDNDKFDELTEYLFNIDNRYKYEMIKEAYSYTQNVESYIRNLRSKFHKYTNHWPNRFTNEQNNIIEGYYSQFREESETFKAIYRLSVIGVIKDYTVDYNLNSIKIWIQKLNDQEYIDNLFNYFSRYVSKEEALNWIKPIVSKDTESILTGCSKQLVEFVYEKVKKKRVGAIDSMFEACKQCVDGSSADFKEFINNYLDSKYSRKLREYATNYDIDAVWQFIHDTKGTSENIKHLRGGCENLLVSYPENPIFLLLRAFSKIMQKNPDKSGFSNDFRMGWEQYINLKRINRVGFIKLTNKFLLNLQSYNKELEEFVADEFIHIHNSWLKEFNFKFTK